MKTTERHRLKENEVAYMIDHAMEAWGANRQRVLGVAVAIVLVAVAAGGYWFWSSRTASKSGALFGDAMSVLDSPVTAGAPGKPAPAGSYPTDKARLEAALAKFVVAAEAYPKSESGLLARNQAAGLLVLLDRPAEGIKRYQEVMDLAGQSSIFYEMARLGKVSAQAQAKQFDEAISTFQSLSANKDGEVPADAMLMQLGRVYLLAGKVTEARQTFRKLLDEFPQSPFVTEAKREFDQLSQS
jgi:hypothetical protein